MRLVADVADSGAIFADAVRTKRICYISFPITVVSPCLHGQLYSGSCDLVARLLRADYCVFSAIDKGCSELRAFCGKQGSRANLFLWRPVGGLKPWAFAVAAVFAKNRESRK
jgi:hypothetical protein